MVSLTKIPYGCFSYEFYENQILFEMFSPP